MPTDPRPCAHCGKPIAKSLREGPKRYAARKYCSRNCGNEAQTTIPVAEKNCLQCGKPITRNPRDSRWKHAQRRYCGVLCASRGGHEARWAFNKRSREKLAPDGYVFDGRFPTPAGVRTWVSVSGPDSGVTVTTRKNGVTRSPRTLRMLNAAFAHHPDLRDAFTGTLSDSWVQQDAASFNG